MNWYKNSQTKVTMDTRLQVDISMTAGEILALDKYIDYGKNERLVRDVILRIIRTYPGLIRMHTEGKI